MAVKYCCVDVVPPDTRIPRSLQFPSLASPSCWACGYLVFFGRHVLILPLPIQPSYPTPIFGYRSSEEILCQVAHLTHLKAERFGTYLGIRGWIDI